VVDQGLEASRRGLGAAYGAVVRKRDPTLDCPIIGESRHYAMWLLAAVLVLVPIDLSAQEIRISRADCAEPVGLVVRQAPLSRVLKRLGESLGFALIYLSQSDPLVTRNARLTATDLIRALAHDMNFSIEEAFDPSCLQGRRVTKLSVLPDTADESRAGVTAQSARQTPEIERIARQTMVDYLQSHGQEDQSVEDIAVR
jgi:hypothetical protein